MKLLVNFCKMRCPYSSYSQKPCGIGNYCYDRKGYDFQAIGDYVLSRSTLFDDDFEVQVRYIARVQGPESDDAISVADAVAMTLNGEHLEFYSAHGGTITAYADGQELTDFPVEFPEVTLTKGTTSYLSYTYDTFEITTSDGKAIKISGFGPRTSPLVPLISDISILLPNEYYGNLEGLLGNGNDDPRDDLRTRDGILLDNSRPEYLYFGESFESYFDGLGGDTFRDSWSLFYGASQSLFTRGTDPFSRTYPRDLLDLSSFGPQAVNDASEECTNAGISDPWILRTCTFDVAATGNPAWIGVALGIGVLENKLSIIDPLQVIFTGDPVNVNVRVIVLPEVTSEVSWNLTGSNVDSSNLTVNGHEASFTASGGKAEYQVTASLVDDPSENVSATIVLIDPMVVTPNQSIMFLQDSQTFNADVADGFSVDWLITPTATLLRNGNSVTFETGDVPNKYMLTAYLVEEPAREVSIPINVLDPELKPVGATVNINETISFRWLSTTDLEVEWFATGGSINENGVYTAASLGTHSITATLVQDNTISASTTVQVVGSGASFFELVSKRADGTKGNNHSDYPAISADGRYIVFTSDANNLVLEDTNNREDIFLKDITTGAIQRVNVAADGTQGNSSAVDPSISADGRYVVFESGANNLVVGDTNSSKDVFLKDVVTGDIQLVSIAADGTQGSGFYPSISADGRYVAFGSYSSNLVPEDTNSGWDVFLKDIITGAIQRVNVAADGTQANAGASGENLSISADGNYVVFDSNASNLVVGDTNGTTDIFLKNVTTGDIQLVITIPIKNLFYSKKLATSEIAFAG